MIINDRDVLTYIVSITYDLALDWSNMIPEGCSWKTHFKIYNNNSYRLMLELV